MAAFSDKLSFVTVMDIAVVDSAILNGGTFEYLSTDTTHELPFQGIIDETILSITVNSVPVLIAGVDQGSWVTTVVDGDISLSDDGGTTTLLIDWDGTITNGYVQDFAITVIAQTVAVVVPDTGILSYVKPEGTLDTLTISNISQEGPRKEARGGKNAQPIVRYGKTMRLEVEDVVFNIALAPKFFGATLGYTGLEVTEVSVGELFPKSISLIGDTYIVDKITGDRSSVYVTFPKFLPDGVFDISMESEGDIGMISIAGELFSEAGTQGDFFVISDKT